MSSRLCKFTARFIHSDTCRPLTGANLIVRFLDRDVFRDDLLCVGGFTHVGPNEPPRNE